MEQTLQELTNLGSAGVQQAVEHYARWYFISAVGWELAGIILIICGIKLFSYKNESDFWDEIGKYIIPPITLIVGVIMVIYNLATIIAPTAYAIHQLINDIKP